MKEFVGKVDFSIYSLQALKLAAFVLEKWEYSFSGNEVKVKGESPNIGFKELLNEALNQQCRIDLWEKNSKIANLIVTKSMISALGEEEENR